MSAGTFNRYKGHCDHLVILRILISFWSKSKKEEDESVKYIAIVTLKMRVTVVQIKLSEQNNDIKLKTLTMQVT